MNYVWEAALAADEAGIRREEVRYVPVRNGSPYTEVVLENINDKKIQSPNVEMNPLYRFAKEFSCLFDINLEGYEITRQLVFEIFMQYLIQQDLRQGLSRQEYALRFLLRDLTGGICGSETIGILEQFDKMKIRRLLCLILKLYQCGSSVWLFREVMRCMYPKSLVYANNDETRQILAYIGIKETKQERERLEFLQDLFLPINDQIYLFWEHHFGIIDVEATMVMDEMVLF